MAKDPGQITRLPNGNIEVIATGFGEPLEGLNITCENPTLPKRERIYHKIFTKTLIYLPNEYEQAVREVLRGRDVVVLGPNGYSNLTEEECLTWGVKVGAYEAACEALLTNITMLLQEKFPGIDVRFAHGASWMFIDGVTIRVANKLNRPQLGHSCPRYMFYVRDEGVPVYVGKDKADYSDKFVESLDILIAANGRVTAFQHDINAAFLKLKHIILVNVLRSISETGGPPAIGPDGYIEDAVAAFEQRVHMMATQLGFVVGHDKWGELVSHAQEVVVSICRNLISPERAFSV